MAHKVFLFVHLHLVFLDYMMSTIYLLDFFNIWVLLLLVALVRLHSLLGFIQHHNLAQQESPYECADTKIKIFMKPLCKLKTTHIALHEK